MSHLHKFPLLTAEEIAASPTIKEGWTATKEASVRKKAALRIFQTSAGHKYKMSASTATFAVTFFVRYYTRRSMQRNHPFLIAVASLFLAGKVNDEPRSLDSIIYFMLKNWYGDDNEDVHLCLADVEYLKNLRETVSDAELSLILVLGCDFNIDPLHATTWGCVKTIKALSPLLHDLQAQQFLISFCNDIMKGDPTLVLQYRILSISLAVLQFYIKLSKKIKQPHDEDGLPWYEAQGLSAEVWKEISARLAKFYVHKSSKDAGTVKATGAGPSMPTEAESTMNTVETTAAAGTGRILSGGGGGAASSAHIELKSTTTTMPPTMMPMVAQPTTSITGQLHPPLGGVSGISGDVGPSLFVSSMSKPAAAASTKMAATRTAVHGAHLARASNTGAGVAPMNKNGGIKAVSLMKRPRSEYESPPREPQESDSELEEGEIAG